MTVRTKKRYHEHEAFWHIRKVNTMQAQIWNQPSDV